MYIYYVMFIIYVTPIFLSLLYVIAPRLVWEQQIQCRCGLRLACSYGSPVANLVARNIAVFRYIHKLFTVYMLSKSMVRRSGVMTVVVGCSSL